MWDTNWTWNSNTTFLSSILSWFLLKAFYNNGTVKNSGKTAAYKGHRLLLGGPAQIETPLVSVAHFYPIFLGSPARIECLFSDWCISIRCLDIVTALHFWPPLIVAFRSDVRRWSRYKYPSICVFERFVKRSSTTGVCDAYFWRTDDMCHGIAKRKTSCTLRNMSCGFAAPTSENKCQSVQNKYQYIHKPWRTTEKNTKATKKQHLRYLPCEKELALIFDKVSAWN